MRFLTFLSLTALATLATAHDLYLLPERFLVTQPVVLQVGFHNGDAFPESEVSPYLERLKEAQISAAGQHQPVQKLRVDGKRAVGEVAIPGPGTWAVSVRTIPNLIELAPNKFLDYLKEEGLQHVIDWRTAHGQSGKPGRERYSKYAKSYVQSGPPSETQPPALGFPIEIVTERNPYLLHKGDELPVQLLLRGKPVANLQVEAAWAGQGQSKTTVIGRTDANGRIRVPLTAAGQWRLHSLYMERCAEPAVADWESLWASLTFAVR